MGATSLSMPVYGTVWHTGALICSCALQPRKRRTGALRGHFLPRGLRLLGRPQWLRHLPASRPALSSPGISDGVQGCANPVCSNPAHVVAANAISSTLSHIRRYVFAWSLNVHEAIAKRKRICLRGCKQTRKRGKRMTYAPAHHPCKEFFTFLCKKLNVFLEVIWTEDLQTRVRRRQLLSAPTMQLATIVSELLYHLRR